MLVSGKGEEITASQPGNMSFLQRMRSSLDYMIKHEVPADQVPDSVREQRLSICQNCPTDEFRKVTRQCKKCGCFMDIKARLIYDPVESVKNAEHVKTFCPSGHWPAFVQQIEKDQDHDRKAY